MSLLVLLFFSREFQYYAVYITGTCVPAGCVWLVEPPCATRRRGCAFRAAQPPRLAPLSSAAAACVRVRGAAASASGSVGGAARVSVSRWRAWKHHAPSRAAALPTRPSQSSQSARSSDVSAAAAHQKPNSGAATRATGGRSCGARPWCASACASATQRGAVAVAATRQRGAVAVAERDATASAWRGVGRRSRAPPPLATPSSGSPPCAASASARSNRAVATASYAALSPPAIARTASGASTTSPCSSATFAAPPLPPSARASICGAVAAASEDEAAASLPSRRQEQA